MNTRDNHIPNERVMHRLNYLHYDKTEWKFLLMDKIKRKHITSKKFKKGFFNNNKTIVHQIRFYREKSIGIIIYSKIQMHLGPD